MLQLMTPPPRNPIEISVLAQRRLDLPNRPSQGEIANRISDLIGEVIGQQAISYWEKGKVDLRNVHPRRLRAYAKVLKISESELAEAGGYDVSELFPDSVAEPESPQVAPQRPLPETLLEASERYGDTHKALKNPNILQQLAAVRHWDGGPRTAEDWVEFYIDNRRRFKD